MWLPEGGELAAALVNAIVLALWAALPLLILGYIRQAQAARRIRPQFSLRKSEIFELDRAVALYDQVCRHLEAIEQHAQTPTRFWRALFDRTDEGGEAHTEERDDLQAHAQHLRGTIARLKRRPLQRLHAWVHAISAQSALAGAIAAYGIALALAIAASQAPGQAAWADELNAGARHALVWYPLDARLFYANAVAAGIAVAAAALFYLLRRARLRRDYELEICAFKDLAYSNPLRPAEPSADDQAPFEPSQWVEANENNADDAWLAVLGLSPAATIEDVRNAYKTLIKQNHPDRVHGMAPVFRALAEAETKRINAAYRQALLCIPQAQSYAA
jgi:hypothetical protein